MKDTLGRENRVLVDRVCPACGATFRPARASSRYCSRPCMWSRNGGHNRKDECWWVNPKGYVEGRVWVEGKQVNVKRHRWLVEQRLGRPLAPDEDVHHVNGIKSDNRPENLLVVSHGDHTRITNSERSYRRGYKLNLSPEQRTERAERMRRMRAAQKH